MLDSESKSRYRVHSIRLKRKLWLSGIADHTKVEPGIGFEPMRAFAARLQIASIQPLWHPGVSTVSFSVSPSVFAGLPSPSLLDYKSTNRTYSQAIALRIRGSYMGGDASRCTPNGISTDSATDSAQAFYKTACSFLLTSNRMRFIIRT